MSIEPFDVASEEDTRFHLAADDDVPAARFLPYAAGALAFCLRRLDRADLTTADLLPADFRIAYLLVLCDLWEHRASQSEIQLYKNPAADMILFPLRDLRDKQPEPEV